MILRISLALLALGLVFWLIVVDWRMAQTVRRVRGLPPEEPWSWIPQGWAQGGRKVNRIYMRIGTVLIVIALVGLVTEAARRIL